MIDRHSGRLLSDFTLKSPGRFSPRVDRGCLKPADFRKLPDGLVRGLTFKVRKYENTYFISYESTKYYFISYESTKVLSKVPSYEGNNKFTTYLHICMFARTRTRTCTR